MRKILFLFGFLLFAYTGFSQENAQTDSIPGYIRIGTIPSFTVYKAPDSSAFTNKNIKKGKPLLLMLFSPDCGHCQHVATEILKNIDHFKNTRILMFTWLSNSDMMEFYKTYKIADYPQITMAREVKYFFLPYYHVTTYPKLIAYNKKGKFVKEFQGDIQIEQVWQAMGKK